MSEKPKTSSDKTDSTNHQQPVAPLAELSDAEWREVRNEGLKILAAHLPLARARGVRHVAIESLAIAQEFFAVCKEVREGKAELPVLKPAFGPPRMVEVVYDDPDAPGQKVTRLEKSDDGACCPNLPREFPLNQKNREAWEAAQPEREANGPYGDGGLTRT